MSGNTSKTFIEELEDNKIFVKKVPVDRFDTRTLTFQSNLRQIIQGKFNINRYEDIKVVSEGSELFYRVTFECLDEKKWAINQENMELIGKAMAYIHNHSWRNIAQISLNVKEETYDRIQDWQGLSDDIPFKAEAQKMREEIFEKIGRVNTDQLKIPLHRDFKPHNIIFDGEDYHLIDFDFAAVDYISLEVMGFIVDIIETGLGNVESFLKAYLSKIEVPVKPESFVDDYLNYLCTNTFPFYMHENLEPQNFKNLVDHRNKSLETLWRYSDRIKQTIEELSHENV